MKKILATALACVMSVSAFACLAACGDGKEKETADRDAPAYADGEWGAKLDLTELQKGDLGVISPDLFGLFLEDINYASFALDDNLIVNGSFETVASSTSKGKENGWTEKQLRRFWGLLDAVKRRGIPIPKIHAQSTYGLLNYPDLSCDYVRVGIALYGVLSYVNRPTRVTPDLRPVLALKTVVTALRPIRAGEAVGYGRAYAAPRDAVVATLAVGYRDGVPRPLSGTGHVAIRGRLAPIVGKICMDNMTVDASAITDVRVGDTATVIGGPLPAPLVAEQAGAFTPELLGRLSPDLPVVRLNTRPVR